MSKPLISISSLYKQYTKGAKVYGSLREQLANVFKKKENSHEDFWALHDINFNVLEGEVLGIIGPNGAGKSTLLKILSRITPPTKGKIVIDGSISSLLEVGTGFHHELTGRENIYLNGLLLGMKKTDIKLRLDEIIEFSGVANFVDTPVKHYSSGMAVRLAFSVAAHLVADILLIDEVLAVGDAEFQKKCFEKMNALSNNGKTILFVSHQLHVIQQVCNRCLLLREGKIRMDAKPTKVVQSYLTEVSKENEVFFPGKPVHKIRVAQEKDTLLIFANYDMKDKPVKIPFLGFVIYDVFGNPISGSNPTLAESMSTKNKFSSKGIIKIKIEQPKLLDGWYSFSFWFSTDGYLNIQQEDRCLSIAISNMASIKKKYDTKAIGNVEAVCSYFYNCSEDKQNRNL